MNERRHLATIMGLMWACTAFAGPTFDTDNAARLFPDAASHTVLKGMAKIVEVRDAKGEVLGWAFRTDRVSPQIRGSRAEIGVLVALNRDKTIRAVEVEFSREDPQWFDKIGADFYEQFKGRRVDLSFDDVDTVTGATLSSRAMVQDIFLSARKVLEHPDVAKHFAGAAVPQQRRRTPATRR